MVFFGKWFDLLDIPKLLFMPLSKVSLIFIFLLKIKEFLIDLSKRKLKLIHDTINILSK